MGIGRNYVFFDHLLFNFEITYAYTFGLSHLVRDNPQNERTKSIPYIDAALSNLLTFRIGLGCLPF